MTIEEIKQKVASKEYNFLRENEHLGKNIILLGLGGSHAYLPDKPDYNRINDFVISVNERIAKGEV